MSYDYIKKADNVYLLDTQMFGFERFHAAYLVAGKEIALIDTGAPTSLEVVRAAIKDSGFAIKDISYIFVTHAEHPDHSGNVGALLKENSRALVYVAPTGSEYLTNPEIEANKRKINLSPQMVARFGEMVPVPRSRIRYVKDNDSFDLGNGEKLIVKNTPGHQPSGIVLLEEKNNGLFINDLPGASFADAGASFIFTPFRSDVKKAMESLNKLIDLPVSKLYLGHFGICDRPKEVINNALEKMQQLLDIWVNCKGKYDPEEIIKSAINIRMLEAEKLRIARGAGLYEYLSQELIPSMSKAFAEYLVNSNSKV